jgi:hypothetical protein
VDKLTAPFIAVQSLKIAIVIRVISRLVRDNNVHGKPEADH